MTELQNKLEEWHLEVYINKSIIVMRLIIPQYLLMCDKEVIEV